jgi:hypothetical protein
MDRDPPNVLAAQAQFAPAGTRIEVRGGLPPKTPKTPEALSDLLQFPRSACLVEILLGAS